MRKEVVAIKRSDAIKQMTRSLGIKRDLTLNEFLNVLFREIVNIDDTESPFFGYDFEVIDDDYIYHSWETNFDPHGMD